MYPICSMNGIVFNICLKNHPNVGKSTISEDYVTANIPIEPYGSKHCLRRYFTLQTIVNYTPVTLPKKVRLDP